MKTYQRITLEDICYLLTFERKTLLVSSTGQQSILATSLSDFEEKIKPTQTFIRISKKLLINRNFVQNMNSKYVTLTNGTTFTKTGRQYIISN